MCDPMTIGIIAGVAGVMKGYAAKQQGAYTNDVAKYNARNIDNQAIQTRNKGTEAENVHREKVAQMNANQRVALGANSVDLNSGSPLQLQEDTEMMGNVDALRIRSNYTDEATNLNDKANLVRSEGAMAKKAGNRAFNTSLLMAAGSVGAGWYSASSSLNTSSMVDSAPVVTAPVIDGMPSWLDQPEWMLS